MTSLNGDPPVSSTQQGYILIMTIAALALLALGGAYIGHQVSTALRLAIAEQTQAEEEKLARDTMARMIYLVATTKRSAIGLGSDDVALRMDGRWYSAPHGMAVSVKDGRGLVNLATAPRAVLERLLLSYGVPAERTGFLIDALDDYSDSDSLKRLNGAEAEEYARQKMPPPRNQPLLVPAELKRVLGWASEDKLWQEDSILEQTVISEHTGVNPATADWRTLMTSLGLSEMDARAFITARADLNAAGISQLSRPFFGAFSGNDLLKLHQPVLYPSATVVITTTKPGSRRAWRLTMTLTPSEHSSPWRVTNFHTVTPISPITTEILTTPPDLTAYRAYVDYNNITLPF